MVEGSDTFTTDCDDCPGGPHGVGEDFGSSYSHNIKPLLLQSRVALRVTLWPISHVVRNSVNFDAKLRGSAIEVEDIGSNRMLSAKFQTALSCSQFAP